MGLPWRKEGARTPWRHLVGEVWRYAAVGFGATVVAFIIFNVLVHGWGWSGAPLHSRPEVGYIVANLVGMLVSYRGTRKWAFRNRDTWHPDGGRTAFFAINIGTMALPLACLWFSRMVLGLDDPLSDNLSANLIGLTLGNAARFFLTRHLVFNVHKYDAEPVASLVDEAA